MTAPTAEGQPPELALRLERAIDRVMWDRRGPLLAAMRVLGEPDIADALAAAPKLRRLAERHQPVRWSEDSPTVVCSCGHGSYDHCPDGLILRGEA